MVWLCTEIHVLANRAVILTDSIVQLDAAPHRPFGFVRPNKPDCARAAVTFNNDTVANNKGGDAATATATATACFCFYSWWWRRSLGGISAVAVARRFRSAPAC